MIAVEALFVVLAAMGLLFTGAGLLIALVEEVLGPIWEGWMGMESYGEDPSPGEAAWPLGAEHLTSYRWEDQPYREGGR